MSFGISHLGPALPAFMARHPEVMLDVHFSDELIDVVGAGLRSRAAHLVACRTPACWRAGCVRCDCCWSGAPAYFERHGRPTHPRDLATHRALRYVNTRAGEAWRFRACPAGRVLAGGHDGAARQQRGRLGTRTARRLGPGTAAGVSRLAGPRRTAPLETALDDWAVPPIALHIVTPPGRSRPARVQVLIDYLADHIGQAPWAHPRFSAIPPEHPTAA